MREIPKEHLNVMEPSPDSLGGWLASARRARGLEQREVAHRISVDLRTLQAIEDNDFDSLGAPVFVRSYLTRYARLLNLPEAQILEQYRQLGTDKPPPLRVGQSIQPQASMHSAGFRWVTYLGLLGLLAYGGWLGLQEVSSRFAASDADRPLVTAGSDGSAVLTLPQAPAAGEAPPSVAPPSVAPPSVAPPSVAPPPAAPETGTALVPLPQPFRQAPEPLPAPAEQAVSSRAAAPQAGAQTDPVMAQAPESGAASEEAPADGVAPDEDAPEQGPPAPSGESRLVMEFAEDCWVDVKDARGNRLAYGVMKAGTARSLTGVPPFSLVMGNSVAVSLTLDGRAVARADYVPRQGTVSRVVLGKPGG